MTGRGPRLNGPFGVYTYNGAFKSRAPSDAPKRPRPDGADRRDELAAETKRQRKAAKAREDAARRVAGMVPESYAEDVACEQEMMDDLYEETVRGLASSDYDYLNGGYKR